MKKNPSTFASVAILAGVLISNAFAATATIDLSAAAEKQVIRGYGGMNHPEWIGDLTDAQRATVFGNGANQMGFSVVRIFVNEDKNQWSKALPTAKYAYDRGLLVFASPWNPPSSMTETFTRDGKANQKRLKAGSYAAYATHLNDFVTYMKNNGVNLYAISVQNEPDYAHDWTWWTSAEMVKFLKENASVINCRIIAPESFQYTKSMSDPILNDAQALAQVDILGTHTYGTQVSQFPYPLFKQKGAGKELWMTEVYTPNSEANSGDKWPEALGVAEHVHNGMVEAEFQMYVWWYIRRSYSPLKEDGTISKRGYMISHFSKFVRPGFKRVDATKTPATNVLVSAYKSADSVVIVAINKNTSAVSQEFTISGGTVARVTGSRTTGSANMEAVSAITLSNGSFTASLPAQSVTTFVGTRSGTTTVSSSSRPPSSSSIAASSSSRPPSSSSVAAPSSSSKATYTVTCNINNLQPSYPAGSSIPRPNVTCSNGATAGTASFVVGSSISGWESPGGSHNFWNSGTRAVTLSSVECNGTRVDFDPPISCGSFQIIAPSSSSSTESSSSSEDGETPILNSQFSILNSKSATYYNIKGEPLGNTKPQRAGVYIVKQGNSVQKIAVR